MIKVQTPIFHLGNARIVIRKTLAFCGLVSILLTASCAPTPSGTDKVATPHFDETLDDSPGKAIQVSPEEKPQTQPVADVQTPVLTKPESEVHEIKPEPKPAPVQREMTPASVPAAAKPTLQSSASQSGGGGAGDAGGGSNDRPTDDDIRSVIARLASDTYWAMRPLFIETYRDSTGKRHDHFRVSSGKSKELKEILSKISDDLIMRKESKTIKFDIREHGPCDSKEPQKAASAKVCDVQAPICLSLENIKAATPKATLEQSLKSLIMHEIAHQNCANEDVAKQVERYYDLPALKNYRITETAASTFNRLRVNLLVLRAGLTTGVMPYQGKDIYKVDTKEQICSALEQGAAQAEILQELIAQSGFVRDPEVTDSHNPEPSPRVVLTETLQNAAWMCREATLDRPKLLSQAETAIKIYDQLAQEFSKNSHWIVIDFSKHLWPYWNDDELDAESK